MTKHSSNHTGEINTVNAGDHDARLARTAAQLRVLAVEGEALGKLVTLSMELDPATARALARRIDPGQQLVRNVAAEDLAKAKWTEAWIAEFAAQAQKEAIEKRDLSQMAGVMQAAGLACCLFMVAKAFGVFP
ncbi:hypothetical protein FIU89_11250 [Roseovarius sp. THAF27]|uniref:hypothetical protein n=1 Tax=Roseovarius sp. THAF27 TaxID=2587850 RepID=UPI0012694109|nr:hypothetical protein [Roseovarius sp. THAF27]QFT81186.1 hypothetical protein FIU89_11250 [Roseovarius sp. THAF27]